MRVDPASMASIGKQATAGCIRLLNDNIAELYAILPVGSTVVIHE